MGFFSNLFHHNHKNEVKQSVSATAPSLTSPQDESSHDQALDSHHSFRSTFSSTHINSNSSATSRLSIDSMASSFSSTTQNVNHHKSMANPFHFLHTHTSHHNPQRMSIRDFSRQYLEVLDTEKTRQLLNQKGILNQSLHSIVVNRGGDVSTRVDTGSGQNVSVSENNNLVMDESERTNVVTTSESLNKSTESVTISENSEQSQSQLNESLTSGEGVQESSEIPKEETNRLSTENSHIIRNIKKQHVNSEEKQTFKKFIVENEKYISTLDEIFQVCIYGQAERLKELLISHKEKSKKFSLIMGNLRMTGSVIDMNGDGENKNAKRQSWSHCTLVHLAARFNQVDVLDMLIKDFASEENMTDILNCEDDIHATPLFHAVTAGAMEATTFLCSFTQNIKINVKDVFECSPLWYAINRKDFEMANILLTFGADMYFKIHGGESYLHRACDNNDIAMVKYILLGIGMDDDIDLTNQKTLQIFEERQSLFLRSDQRHQTPLFNSIKSYQDNLKRRKSDPMTLNDSQNPQKEQVMDFLLTFFCEHAPVLLQKALDQTNHYGHNVIHYCAEQDAFQQLLKLVKYFETDEKLKLALNLKDKILGNTPLHISIMTSHYDIFKLFINCSEIELNVPNQQLDLPLHVALRQHKLRMCQYLYIHYSQQDLDAKNAQRYSSLKLAKRLDINLKKLAEGSVEEFEKKKATKNVVGEKKWWHIFKIHRQTNNQDSRKSMVEKGQTTPLEEIVQNESDFTSACTVSDASMSDMTTRTTFPLVIWTKELTLGVDIIDTQHHALVDIINKLIKLLFGEDNAFIPDRSGDEWILGYVIGNLLEYTEFHFETEEKVMKKYQKLLPDGYLDEHHQEHEEFTSKIHKLHQEYLESHSTVSFLNVDLLNYLLNWLVTHIMGSDHILVSHLTKGGQKIEP